MIKETVETRFMFWKKQFFSLLFWLLLPLLATLLIMYAFEELQEDTEVPIGIVLEEETSSIESLYEEIENTPHVRPVLLSEREAIRQLKTHELDSVFVIKRSYENNIFAGNRDRLIKSFQTDFSFSYAPMKEVIISYVQQDYSRACAAEVVRDLGRQYGIVDEWSVDELISRSRAIEKEQDLLGVNFFYLHDDKGEVADQSLLKEKNIWALFAFLSTFMLFDWVIKERRSSAMLRLPFMRVSAKSYLLNHLIFYTFSLFLIDLLTVFVFLDESFTVKNFIVLLSFRLMLNTSIFILSLFFRSTYKFYTVGFAFTLLLSIAGSVFIPMDEVADNYPLYRMLNPLQAFLSNDLFNFWLCVSLIFIIIWYVRRERDVISKINS